MAKPTAAKPSTSKPTAGGGKVKASAGNSNAQPMQPMMKPGCSKPGKK